LQPSAGAIFLRVALAKRVNLNGWALVLWDPDTRQLAIKPTSVDDPNAVAVRPQKNSRNTLQVSHRRAVRLTGLTAGAQRQARVSAGMIVVTIGKPPAAEDE
jgi:hypothetical protein